MGRGLNGHNLLPVSFESGDCHGPPVPPMYPPLATAPELTLSPGRHSFFQNALHPLMNRPIRWWLQCKSPT